LLSDGSLSKPALAFGSETGSGIYRIGPGNWGVSVGGVVIWDIAGTRIAANKRIDVNVNGAGNGASIDSGASATVPSLKPNWNNTNTGIGTAGTNLLSLIAGGVEGAQVTSSSFIAKLKLITSAQTLTIADNGNGATRAAVTLTPTASYVSIICNDTQGCDIMLSETGAVDGQILRVVCATTNVCGFTDSPGVSELAGSVDLGQWDTLSLLYVSDRWVETARSNN